LRQSRNHAAEQTGNGEGADSDRAAAGARLTSVATAFEADQQRDAERDRETRDQFLKVHGRSTSWPF
jgi:hypothetical protein